MSQKRTCGNCVRGSSISVNNDVMCRLKGPVTQDYVCTKHKFAPEPKSFKEANYKCLQCDNFILGISSGKEPTSTGLCRLFTYRQYDGKTKNACSKFVRKSELEVS